MDDDAFLSAMADACKAAGCQPPIPGPLDTVTTWELLTQLGQQLEQQVFMPVQHHVLHVVQEWSVLVVSMAVCGSI